MLSFCSFSPYIPFAKRTGAAALRGTTENLGSTEIVLPRKSKEMADRKPCKTQDMNVVFL